MDKSYTKINCFMLHGASNARKTFCMNPSATYQGTNHSVQRLQIPKLRKQRDHWNTRTYDDKNGEKIEGFKKVIECLPTHLNVKNKPSQLMERMPVILTTNTVPHCSDEQMQLRKRIFAYTHRRCSAVLSQITRSPDPITTKRNAATLYTTGHTQTMSQSLQTVAQVKQTKNTFKTETQKKR